ncbi:ankyrin repeat domain-containing protein [Candidatus Wolbachia massiliensis]|uniref:Ankyrin repeat domain-containing protein n=1 Tax=Candidatus Wolbachia massiliensis TaxID=1845000 RepID=A0A7M3U2J5_9RICK|nr:ankyrin repeat domain-containing protein [Candidatus Wolbachia massiliensis]QOD38630.1 ankyrin repeat domain-containing protein [Candidatus Wolbachia massiliensis]
MRQHYKKKLKIPKDIEEACEVLGINGMVLTQKKIFQVYKKLALKYHPDKHNNCSEKCKSSANANMQALNQARTLLINILKKTCSIKVRNKWSNETPKTGCNEQNVKPNIANSFINKNVERARKLIKQKVKIKDILGFFVKNACEDNDWYEFLKEFLSEQGNKVDLNLNIFIVDNTFQGIECTVLYYACIQGNKSVAELLLKHEADVNKVNHHFYRVPICFALENNDHDLVSLLFQYGAKIDVTTEVEQKIIDNSCSKHSRYTKETMEILLQYTSPKQNTEILKHFSDSDTSTNGDIEIVQLLLNKGANPDYGNPSTMQTAVAKGNTQLEQLFRDHLAGQLKNLQKERAPLAIACKEGTIQPQCNGTNGETTTPPITKEVNSRPKILEVLTLNPTAPADDIRNQTQEKEVKVTQDFIQDADVNNNQVTEQPSKIPSDNGLNSNTQTKFKLTNSKAYAIGIGCGMGIAYFTGATALTPTIAAVAVFIAVAVVGALVGYGIGKLCEKVSEERQKDRHMSIGTAIKNVLTPECLKSQEVHP